MCEKAEFVYVTDVFDHNALRQIEEGMRSLARYAPAPQQKLAMRQIASSIREYRELRSSAVAELRSQR